MKKIVIFALSLSSGILYPAAQQSLKIKTLTKQMAGEVPFTAQTTILQLKQALEQSEGVPAAQQRLVKNEGWALKSPLQKLAGKWSLCSPFQEVRIALDNNQTCGDYDLQPNGILELSLRLRQNPANDEKTEVS